MSYIGSDRRFPTEALLCRGSAGRWREQVATGFPTSPSPRFPVLAPRVPFAVFPLACTQTFFCIPLGFCLCYLQGNFYMWAVSLFIVII